MVRYSMELGGTGSLSLAFIWVAVWTPIFQREWYQLINSGWKTGIRYRKMIDNRDKKYYVETHFVGGERESLNRDKFLSSFKGQLISLP